MEHDHYQQHAPSFRQKIKHSICSYSSCFLTHNQTSSPMELEQSPTTDHQINQQNSPSSWIKSRANDFLSEEIKEKWLALFNRIGRRHAAAGRKGSNSYDWSEFSYDPLSYALNFEDHDDTRFDEYPPLWDFSARLPQSPPRKVDKNRPGTAIVPAAATPRQVAACG